jgi:xanthine dehydrogenase accessory factor
MCEEFYKKLEELRKQNALFVEATVVHRQVPSSGKSGDKAIIDRFGEMTGWIGGGCVKGIALKEAEDAMKTGKARLVKIGTSLSGSRQDGVIEYKMTCMSEGTVEIFLEPVLPATHLVVIGKTLIAKALVALAKASAYRVTAVAPEAKPTTFERVDELFTQMNLHNVKISPASAIVICTQGENDEQALQQVLPQEVFYKGFVASLKKRTALFNTLLEQGIEKDKIEAIHSPAGIDINAKTPEEVAVSILAEIIQEKNKLHPTGFNEFFGTGTGAAPPQYYINPVCGIPVDINNPKHVVEYNHENVYFCCDGCKVQFDADPEKYIKSPAAQRV